MFPDTLERLRCPCCSGSEERLRAEALRDDPDTPGEWLEGVLFCDACGRWYRIEQGIADLARDALREVDEERAFLARLAARDSAVAAKCTKPIGPDGPAPERSEADQRIVDEGRHWGRFMRHFWEAGDRAIFDLEHRGSHPPFYVAGVLEPDDRDNRRPWGNFSTRAGRAMFPEFGRFAGRWGVDIGSGGGQFALAAARAGVRMVGFDPSFEELALGRRHARAEGIRNVDYVRAEPAHPPFARGAFALLTAKDALHHVPDLDAVFPGLVALLEPAGGIVAHEHIARAPRKEALMDRIRPAAIRKIRRRFPNVDIPPDLLRDSANEDVSADRVRPVLEQYFHARRIVEDLFLANELELLVHFAYGKRRWFSWWFYPLGMAAEKVLFLLGDRQHVTFVGTHKDSQLESGK